MIVFFTQSFIAFLTLGFSMYMIYIGKDPGIYLPIITGIIGYFMPQPNINKVTTSIQKPPELLRYNRPIENDIEQPFH